MLSGDEPTPSSHTSGHHLASDNELERTLCELENNNHGTSSAIVGKYSVDDTM